MLRRFRRARSREYSRFRSSPRWSIWRAESIRSANGDAPFESRSDSGARDAADALAIAICHLHTAATQERQSATADGTRRVTS